VNPNCIPNFSVEEHQHNVKEINRVKYLKRKSKRDTNEIEETKHKTPVMEDDVDPNCISNLNEDEEHQHNVKEINRLKSVEENNLKAKVKDRLKYLKRKSKTKESANIVMDNILLLHYITYELPTCCTNFIYITRKFSGIPWSYSN
jgi:hypothetical protein